MAPSLALLGVPSRSSIAWSTSRWSPASRPIDLRVDRRPRPRDGLLRALAAVAVAAVAQLDGLEGAGRGAGRDGGAAERCRRRGAPRPRPWGCRASRGSRGRRQLRCADTDDTPRDRLRSVCRAESASLVGPPDAARRRCRPGRDGPGPVSDRTGAHAPPASVITSASSSLRPRSRARRRGADRLERRKQGTDTEQAGVDRAPNSPPRSARPDRSDCMAPLIHGYWDALQPPYRRRRPPSRATPAAAPVPPLAEEAEGRDARSPAALARPRERDVSAPCMPPRLDGQSVDPACSASSIIPTVTQGACPQASCAGPGPRCRAESSSAIIRLSSTKDERDVRARSLRPTSGSAGEHECGGAGRASMSIRRSGRPVACIRCASSG